MHHIFLKNAPVVYGKEDQIKSSQVEHFFNSCPFKTCLNISYQVSGSITVSQISTSPLTALTSIRQLSPMKTWVSPEFLPYMAGDRHPSRKCRSKSHWQLCAFSCPVHFVTANISGQQQRMVCHVIILCHYMGSSQILPSEIQACGVIKAFFWSACWLRVGNGTHTAALSPNLREDTKGFAMHSSCYACKTCHSKTNRLKIVFTLAAGWKNL